MFSGLRTNLSRRRLSLLGLRRARAEPTKARWLAGLVIQPTPSLLWWVRTDPTDLTFFELVHIIITWKCFSYSLNKIRRQLHPTNPMISCLFWPFRVSYKTFVVFFFSYCHFQFSIIIIIIIYRFEFMKARNCIFMWDHI